MAAALQARTHRTQQGHMSPCAKTSVRVMPRFRPQKTGLLEASSWRDPESDAKVDSATIVVGPANEWMSRFHNRMPVILDWSDASAWMAGGDPGALLRPPPDDALQEWIVSPRVNRSGAGDDDPTLIEPRFALA